MNVAYLLAFLISFSNFTSQMRPDYPHKLFSDLRTDFSMLMEALAMGSRTS
ncbi:MAG: hypothetical protein QM764_01660 [Chitinophagaceae bacterium]